VVLWSGGGIFPLPQTGAEKGHLDSSKGKNKKEGKKKLNQGGKNIENPISPKRARERATHQERKKEQLGPQSKAKDKSVGGTGRKKKNSRVKKGQGKGTLQGIKGKLLHHW